MGRRSSISREIAVAPSWDLSCLDWQDRIIKGRSLVPNLPLFKEEADRAERAFGMLRLPDVPGSPELRTAAGPWFASIVRALFGSYDAAKQERYIRELFLLVPKKNSKTSYGAALMLTATLLSRRPRAEFLLVAPTQEVADLAFRQAVGMVESDPVLLAKCHVQIHIKKITYRPTGAFLKVKSFDPKIVTGAKPAGVLLDELHVIAEQNDADRVIGQLRGGLISQPEGFLITITTQSEREPAGVFKSELQKARAVRDGRLRAPILPVLYEFPAAVDWRDPKNWPMVTPNNGRSVSVERLVTDYEQAKAAGDAELRRWASQHLNVEIGLALRTDYWAAAEFWEAAGIVEGLTLDQVLERSEVCVVGIDGGGLDDLLGLVVLGRERETRRWLLWSHAWAHKIVLDRRKEIAARLRDFEADGDLSIVNAPGEDVVEVVGIIKRVRDAGLLPEKQSIGVDAVGINDINDALTAPECGFDAEAIVAVSQGWRLNAAIKTTERKVAARELVHGSSRLMAWCVGNAKAEARGNAVLITKQAAGSAKIDPLMAAFNAVSLMALAPAAMVIGEDYELVAV